MTARKRSRRVPPKGAAARKKAIRKAIRKGHRRYGKMLERLA